MAKVIIIVEDGIVTNVLTDSNSIEVEIIDKDSDVPERIDETDKRLEEVEEEIKSGKLHIR